MPPTFAIVFGESHTDAVAEAIRRRGITPHAAFNISHVGLPLGPGMFDAPEMRNALAPKGPGVPQYVSMVGGNGHNIVGLIKHAVPFDFVLPDEPDVPLDPGSEVQTYGYVKAALRQTIGPVLAMIGSAQRAVSGRLLHLDSPPPPEDDGYIRANLDGIFAELHRNSSLVAPMVRYKLWRLHSEIVREACESLGVQFIPAPPEALVDGRYLRPEYYANPTHANALYGELLLRQVEKVMAH